MSSSDVALESYRLFREAGCNHLQACAWLGSEDGETSFRIHVIGDHGEAFGPAQHHQARIDAIKDGTGIDIKTASHADEIRGIIWEMTKGAYHKVMPALQAAKTMQDAITVLVRQFEQSGNQLRDIARRTALGNYWLGQIPDEAPKPATAPDHDAIDGCACGIEHDSHTPDHELPAPRGPS